MRDKRVLAAVSAVVVAALAGAAQAASFIGTDNAAGNYNVAANWDTNAVPTATTAIVIPGGKTANANAGQIDRAADTTIDGSLTTSGRLVLNSTGTSATTTTIGATGSYANNGADYLVGANGSAATTLALNGGSFNMTATRGLQLSNGNNTADAARTGTMNLNSGTFTFTVGSSGIAQIYNGFLAGRGGGTTPDSFNVAGATSLVTVPSGLTDATNTRKFTVANGASVNVSSGSATFNGFTLNRVGFDDGDIADRGTTTSKITVSGGSLTFNMASNGNATAPFFSVGASSTATVIPKGEIDVTGGSLSISGGIVYIGEASTGLVAQSGGSVTLSNPLQLARNAGSTGTYNMSGGTLTIAGGATPLSVGNGTGAFNFSGGSLSLPGDQTGILDLPWFNEVPGTVATYDGGLNRTLITVPEPASLALLGGAALLATIRRRPR